MITQPGHASWRFAETGSRGAVLRRSEGTRFSSRSDDKVGGTKSAIRARDVRAADLQEERRNPSRTELILRHSRFVGADEYSRSPANIAASTASHQTKRAIRHSQRSERSNQTRIARRRAEPSRRAAVLDERARRHALPNQLHLRQLTEAEAHNPPQQDIECLDPQNFGVRGRQAQWIMTQ